MPCDEYQQEYDLAVELWERARENSESARHNLNAAALALDSALLAEIGCFLTIEVPIAFAVCEISALAAAESAGQWVQSAEIALDLAELAEADAGNAMAAAGDTLCDCLRIEHGGDFPEPDDAPDDLEAIEAALAEAESALEESESDGEEAETLLADAEEAAGDSDELSDDAGAVA